MKINLKFIMSIIVIMTVLGIATISKATIAKEESIEEFLKNNTSVDWENFSDADGLIVLQELTQKFTTEELAEIIEQYSSELEEQGIEKEDLTMIENALKTTDTEVLRSIINEVDVEEVRQRVENGEDLEDVIVDSIDAEKMVNAASKMILSNTYLKPVIISFLAFTLIITIYRIVVRWFIYKKAGEYGWAAIIPIYKEVVWLKIAGISPWLLLLSLIPIFGWIAVGIVHIVSCFTLPNKFKQSGLWGIGIWLLPIVFESIVAFSSSFKVEENKEEAIETMD